MKKKLSELAAKTVLGASKAVTVVGDLNGDGKVDQADLDIALGRTKNAAEEIAEEAARLGRTVMRTEMTRDVATGAAIGAAVAIPIPIVGPAVGAVVGAGIGLYKNLTRPSEGSSTTKPTAGSQDPIGDLERLDGLRERGILTEEEFQSQKKKLLRQR